MPKGRTRIEAFATLMCITNRDDPQGAQAVPAAPDARARLRAELGGPARAVARRMLAPLTEAEGETLLALLARLVEAHEAHARPGAGRRPPRRKRTEEVPQCPTPSDAAPPAASASPAVGYAHLHQDQQKALIEAAFAKLKGFILTK